MWEREDSPVTTLLACFRTACDLASAPTAHPMLFNFRFFIGVCRHGQKPAFLRTCSAPIDRWAVDSDTGRSEVDQVCVFVQAGVRVESIRSIRIGRQGVTADGKHTHASVLLHPSFNAFKWALGVCVRCEATGPCTRTARVPISIVKTNDDGRRGSGGVESHLDHIMPDRGVCEMQAQSKQHHRAANSCGGSHPIQPIVSLPPRPFIKFFASSPSSWCGWDVAFLLQLFLFQTEVRTRGSIQSC